MARDRASRPEARPLRLFVAVDVPEVIRAAVAQAVAPLRDAHPRARWVPIENQHVTVKFLGSAYPRLVACVIESVRDVAAASEPFGSAVGGLGAFPSPRRARVLWAGLADPDRRFSRIAGGLDDALAREFRVEKRAFTAHLTLARFDPPVPLEGLEEAGRFEAMPFDVDRLVLYRSHLQRPAPRYEPLAVFPLGRPGA